METVLLPILQHCGYTFHGVMVGQGKALQIVLYTQGNQFLGGMATVRIEGVGV